MLISIIIPCYQNEDQLVQTVERIQKVTGNLDVAFDLLLIDDGSTDGTWTVVQTLCSRFENVRGIRLRSNIGAYNAILAGFEHAKGDAFLVMAADGDDPPELIPELIGQLADVDAVLANRQRSKKGPVNSRLSGLFHSSLRLAGAKNIPKGGSDFLIVKKAVFQRCHAEGFRSGNTLVQLVQHADSIQTLPYTKGSSRPSSWSFGKKVRLFLQTLNQFIPIPYVDDRPSEYQVADYAGLLRSFEK